MIPYVAEQKQRVIYISNVTHIGEKWTNLENSQPTFIFSTFSLILSIFVLS